MNLDRFLSDSDTWLPAHLRAHHLPGLALACIEDGATADMRFYGSADTAGSQAIGPDTLFRVASISKSVAAWAVMVLVERGQLRLDDPIGPCLRRWNLPPSVHDAQGVTLRRLLCHDAGISTAGPGRRPHDGTPVNVIDGLEGRFPTLDEAQRRYYRRWQLPTDEAIHLARAPGTGFAYSNGGYAMLEAMIEDVTGMSYPEFVRSEVLGPLGMTLSGFDPLPKSVAHHCAQPHFENGEAVEDWVPMSGAAGGLWSSITDLARFAGAQVAGANGQAPGRGVLSAKAVQLLHTPHVDAGVNEGVHFMSALGHFVHTDAQGTVHINHTGGFSGWRSMYWTIPAERRGLCVLVNSDGGNEAWVPLLHRWNQHRMAAA